MIAAQLAAASITAGFAATGSRYARVFVTAASQAVAEDSTFASAFAIAIAIAVMIAIETAIASTADSCAGTE